MKDYYALLGVHRTATSGEIKRAFRKLAVRFHPDKNPDPEAENIFKELSEAYDILSDWEKRKMYDLRWENPFGVDLPASSKQTHRDPKYRPKPPGYRPPKRHTIQDTMAEYLPYFRWVSWTGLFIALLVGIDYVIPYQTVKEDLYEVKMITGPKNSFRHFVFITNSGTEIRVYDFLARDLVREERIIFEKTRIFSSVMTLSGENISYTAKVGYIYKKLVYFPLILGISSLLGVAYRKGVEFPFNLSIVSGTFLIITLSLLLFI
jgi:curved DNA-binding protein CbpA